MRGVKSKRIGNLDSQIVISITSKHEGGSKRKGKEEEDLNLFINPFFFCLYCSELTKSQAERLF